MTPRQARLEPAKGRKLTIGRTRRRGESAGRAGKGEATLHNGARQGGEEGAARRKRAKPHNAGERTRWKERREQNRKKTSRHTRVTAYIYRALTSAGGML